MRFFRWILCLFLTFVNCNAAIKCGVVFFLPLLNRLIMSDANMYVTKETFEKMREELHKMKSVDRPASSRAIA